MKWSVYNVYSSLKEAIEEYDSSVRCYQQQAEYFEG